MSEDIEYRSDGRREPAKRVAQVPQQAKESKKSYEETRKEQLPKPE